MNSHAFIKESFTVRTVKKFVALVVAVAVCITLLPTKLASASDFSQMDYIGFYLEDNLFSTDYRYNLYVEFFGHVVHNNLCVTGRHEGKSAKELMMSKGRSLSFSTTLSFNKAFGINVGVEGVLSTTADCGYGLSGTIGMTITSEDGITLMIEKDDPVGYYRIIAASDVYQCWWEKLRAKDEKYIGKGKYYMPTGDSYWLTSYRRTIQDEWEDL